MFDSKQSAPAAASSKAPFFSGIQQKKESTFFQTKLSVNTPGDAFEREADGVADKVVSSNSAAGPVVQKKDISSVQRLATSEAEEKLGTNDARMRRDKDIQTKLEIQRKCASCEKEEEGQVQKSEGAAGGSGGTASSQLSAQITGSSGKGSGMGAHTTHEMQQKFGVDFSHVNIHTGADAVQMNKELGAQAFTHKNDIYFNAGKYNPDTSKGKHLLAHELTHVVQQGAATKNTQTGGTKI
ncbi:eCIS core domain-containing protein [Chitinophaga arvensicola]|uniref:eCIS core domain-containing protein n=1 Tax=Chitinophaga arvensicola TaxID=29529 RepID=A0A1I0S6T9_9BACT|nr:DUF4157 domain-containing protein [Chitinophaga arvensicola]SEW51350.1 protein of unknown function [Chitinophaga arvensicola]